MVASRSAIYASVSLSVIPAHAGISPPRRPLAAGSRPVELFGQGFAGCGSPITLIPAGRLVRERHFNEAGFEGGLQIDRGEVAPVFEVQCCLDSGTAHLSGEDRHELLDVIGDLPGIL